jgi:anti-sigma factor RsiW
MRWFRRRRSEQGLTCQQAVALVTAYLDDELDPVSRALLELHLADCERCTEHLNQIRATIAAAGRVRDEDLQPRARQDLIELYRRWREDPSSAKTW